jgi:hypothetical protein
VGTGYHPVGCESRPVQGEADEKAALAEELAPFVVQEGAVGLHGVLKCRSRSPILLFDLDGPPEEVQAHQGRLSPLPGYGDRGVLLGLYILADIALQNLVGHPKAALRIEVLLGEEETVFAAEIAYRPRGLGHEMKARKWALLAHRPQFSFQS